MALLYGIVAFYTLIVVVAEHETEYCLFTVLHPMTFAPQDRAGT